MPLVIVGVLKASLPALTPTVFVFVEVIPSQLIALEVAPPARVTDPEAKKWEPAAFCPNISEVPFVLNICIPYAMKELY